MKIAIIGAGAIGLYYGAMLQRAGHEVVFLLRRDYEAITNRGLTVCSYAGDFHLEHIKGYRRTEVMGTADLVLICLKTFDNSHLVDLLQPLITTDTLLLTLQNGLGNEEFLAATFGAERIIGGTAQIGCNRGEPGTVHHLAHGAIRIGALNGGLTEEVKRLTLMFNAAEVKCTGETSIKRLRWEKLVWNIPFNGLCALTGATPGILLGHPATRQLVEGLMREVINGASAQGLSLTDNTDRYIREVLARTVKTGDYRPSMMLDRLAGRPLELTAIYEIPLAHVHSAGTDMPRVAMLHALLSLGEHHPTEMQN